MLAADLRDGDTITRPYRGGWRTQWQIQYAIWPPYKYPPGETPTRYNRIWTGLRHDRSPVYRSLARLVERGLIRCAVIRPWDCDNRFQLYPTLRLPLSKQRTRDIRLYAALGAPELDTLPAPGPVALPVTRTENCDDDVTLASQPIDRKGAALTGAVATALRLALRSNNDIDPDHVAVMLGTNADVIGQQIADLKASGDYDRIVNEVLAERDV